MNVKEINIALSQGKTKPAGILPHVAELKGLPVTFKFDFGLRELPDKPGVLCIRGPRQYGKSTWLETQIAQRLESDKAVRPLARGLGAHDSPGATHLLRAEGEPQWWHMLPGRLAVEVGVVRRENVTDPKFARQP